MNSPSELLTIGDVARLAGKAASSVRYYEHIGLIPAPVRISGLWVPKTCVTFGPRAATVAGLGRRAGPGDGR